MDAKERDRKLRLAESAAASAVLNGCDPDEVRRRVEIGIAEAVAMNNRRPGERLPGHTPPAAAEPPKEGTLADWARSVGV